MNTFGQWGPSSTSLTSPGGGLDPVKRRGHGQGTIQGAGERGWGTVHRGTGSGRFGGGAPLRPKIFSISCSFSENLTKSYVGAPPQRVGAPSYRESWIRTWQGCRSVADPEFPRGGVFPVNRMMHRHDWTHYLPATSKRKRSESMIHGPQIEDWANTLKAMWWWRNIECTWRRITGEPP